MLAGEHQASDIDAEHLVPHVHGKLRGGKFLIEALGVDQDIHLAEFSQGGVQQGDYAVFVSRVHGVVAHLLAAALQNLLLGAFQTFFPAAGNGHAGSIDGQTLGNGLADAARAANHHGVFSSEIKKMLGNIHDNFLLFVMPVPAGSE